MPIRMRIYLHKRIWNRHRSRNRARQYMLGWLLVWANHPSNKHILLNNDFRSVLWMWKGVTCSSSRCTVTATNCETVEQIYVLNIQLRGSGPTKVSSLGGLNPWQNSRVSIYCIKTQILFYIYILEHFHCLVTFLIWFGADCILWRNTRQFSQFVCRWSCVHKRTPRTIINE